MISTPSPAAAAASGPGGRPTAGPDYLRVESFGALYYVRETSTYLSLPPRLADFLIRARDQSAVELFAARSELLDLDDERFAEKVVAWQEQGLLDAGYRCPAELIRSPRARGILSAPMITSLFVTMACNLRCAHCFASTYGGKARDGPPLEVIARLFAELERAGAPQLVLAGGEPLLRPDIFELLEEAERRHLDPVLCTNATTLDTAAARRLVAATSGKVQVSIDGPDAATHDAVRGAGSFDKARRGVGHLLEAGARQVILRVTVTGGMRDRLADLAALADELGVHALYIKPFKQTGDASGDSELSLDRSAYRAALERAGPRFSQARCAVKTFDGMAERLPGWTRVQPPFSCTGGTVRATVMADGSVVACGAVRAPDDWTLHEHGFLECWRRAPSIQRWRQLSGNDACRACARFSSCAGGCRARALGRGMTIDDPDPWCGCPD